jgi:hypothetical protein
MDKVQVGLNPTEGLFDCQRCETAQVEETSSIVRGRPNGREIWCADCVNAYAFYCDSCVEHYSRRNVGSHNVETTNEPSDETWCDNCVNDGATWCETCDIYEPIDDVCRSEEQVQLFAYNHKPRVRHIIAEGEDSSVRTYGIELEMEPSHNHRERKFVVEALEEAFGDDFYCKEDGSLTNGVEMVSHPHSLKQWYNLSDELQTVLRESAEQGMRAWTQSHCGLHVHVGWNHFTKSHAMRFTLLFARNEAKWVKAANRSSRYANFTGIQGGVAMKVKDTNWANHFDAVNLNGNGGKTIEVRIWRPSMAVGRILGSIELVDAAFEYTRNMTAHDAITGGLDFDSFVDFVTNSNKWPNAVRIIQNQRFNLKKGE